jgi:hypothetical protein
MVSSSNESYNNITSLPLNNNESDISLKKEEILENLDHIK